MMLYEQHKITEAFRLYSSLAVRGYVEKEEMRLYLVDDEVRGLVDHFAHEVDCTVITAGDRLYLVPKVMSSPHHVTNDTLKRLYFPSKYTNADIYLVYVAIIVLLGEFYDSYQTTEPTRDFLPLRDWLESLSERILALKNLDLEELEKAEREYRYNWRLVVEKWDALDDLRETARTQDGRTNSRLAFLNVVRRFLEAQDLVQDLGEDELALTEKSRAIVQRYYMEIEYNRGLLEFMYQLGKTEEA